MNLLLYFLMRSSVNYEMLYFNVCDSPGPPYTGAGVSSQYQCFIWSPLSSASLFKAQAGVRSGSRGLCFKGVI